MYAQRLSKLQGSSEWCPLHWEDIHIFGKCPKNGWEQVPQSGRLLYNTFSFPSQVPFSPCVRQGMMWKGYFMPDTQTCVPIPVWDLQPSSSSRVWELWHWNVCRLLRLETLDSFFILGSNFRAHLKWKDRRIADVVRRGSTVGIWCYGNSSCHAGLWHNMHQICTCFQKMKLWANM